MSEHSFFIEDLGPFLANLEARKYALSSSGSSNVYSKTLSDAVIKHYAYPMDAGSEAPVRIRVMYELLSSGKPLQKLTQRLKELNRRYRHTLPGFKTKREAAKHLRDRRWVELQQFLQKNRELVECFKYEADDRLTEGNYSFNLYVASTAIEQAICLEFIKALAEAHTPNSLIRRRRGPELPVQQRNGWIRRYAKIHRKRGWRPIEIAREIQKELRNGTWNERSRLQYNLADNTICKIAGIKITHPHLN